MLFYRTHIPGVVEIDLEPYQDNRGSFSRIFCRREMHEAGLTSDFVQTNHSVTTKRGTIRGVHYQIPPYHEAKLIRCVSGSVMDVAVDLRITSPTYLEYIAVELSATNNKMLYIPAGVGHGFQTLEDNSSIVYQHSNYYHPQAERGLRYDDPLVGIRWPLPVAEISEKDDALQFIDADFAGVRI